MTASAINTASNASAAGPAGAAASAKGAAGAGASAGFDALLAALFPQGAPAGAPEATAPGAVAAPQTAPLFAPAPDVEDAPVDESLAVPATEPQAAPVLGSDAAAMLATAQVAQPGPTVQPDQTTATTPAAHAWGRDKAKGAPAQPAILNANPRADLAGKLELAPEATDDASAPATEIAEEAPTGHAPAAAQRGLAQAAAKAAAPAAVVANAPAPPPTADIQLDAPAAPPPAPTEAVAPEAAAPDVAAPQAQALAASQSASKPEAPPAPAARSHRSDRAKTVAEAESHSDLKPLQAADKPVHAKAVDGAAKSAAASTEAKGPELAAPEAEVVADAPEASLPAETRAAEHSAAPAVLSTHAVRGSPETVAHLAAQIIKKLDGQTTRFDVELNPQGLGKVDVRVEIGAHGQLTASMLFDNAQSAQDLKSRAAELQRALEQAGFDLSGGLSFDVADHGRQQGQAWQDQDDNGRAFRGQAFRAALETAGDAADAAAQGALRLRRGVNAGLDLRI